MKRSKRECRWCGASVPRGHHRSYRCDKCPPKHRGDK